jgi:hypothetical protein
MMYWLVSQFADFLNFILMLWNKHPYEAFSPLRIKKLVGTSGAASPVYCPVVSPAFTVNNAPSDWFMVFHIPFACVDAGCGVGATGNDSR